MEEDKIKNLFADYQPELSSDSQFMRRLQTSLDAVESVRRQSGATRRLCKVAMAAGACAGFAAGVGMSFLAPHIAGWISTMLSVADLALAGIPIREVGLTCSWLISGTVAVLIGCNAYAFSLSRN